MSTTVQSLTDAIIHDHKEFFGDYEQYKKAAAKGDIDAQERWANEIIWDVARHAVGEELVLYPLYGQYLGDKGREMAKHDLEQHKYIKECLFKLERMKVGTSEFEALLTDVMQRLREHSQEEEKGDLPALEPHLGADSSSYARSFGRTKMFMPTRAHPNAPDQPPWETLAGFLAAPIDMLKDAFTKFPTKEMLEQRAM